jgi:excisionase family DNA binding protein
MAYLTTKQAAAELSVSENTIRRRIAEGLLRWHDIGVPGRPRIRITSEDLAKYVENGRQDRPA